MISSFNKTRTPGKPSVTELVKILDKPALLNWANKQGLKGIDINRSREKYLSDGASIHKQIEEYQLMIKPFQDSAVQQRYVEFISDKKLISVEKEIETDYFVGRYDCKMEYNGKTYIVDYKSNQSNIYLENKLQLVAYGMGEMCDSFAVVSVPDFTFIEVTIPDRKPYEEILKALSIIYKNKLNL